MCDSGVTVPQNRIMLFNRTFQLRTENDGGTVGMKEGNHSCSNSPLKGTFL